MPETGANPLITALKRNSLDDGPGIRTTVFFKGCPLSCRWCQNPEAKSALQQIVYEAGNCVGCLECTRSCGSRAIFIKSDGTYPVDRQKCTLCGQCVKACRTGALSFAGTAYGADQLCQKLLKDIVFFKNSGGGVTFSGGEPTLHLEYLSVLSQKLKENGIHLCIETSGFYDNERFERELLPFLDLVYFDIKIIDREKHKKYCGLYNDSILRNFETLFRSKKVKVLPRVPLVPGITAERENLIAIRDFFQSCGAVEIGLLPYNPLWLSKLPGIGATAEYSRAEWMTSAEKNEVKEIFKGFSFRNF
ncbi:MAG: glycyl-radical enzyme activating protein [Treponema sp.]|nr:glycyl-radical enzyme activating protein [Treponema sp.]